jgi:hypothetical protein
MAQCGINCSVCITKNYEVEAHMAALWIFSKSKVIALVRMKMGTKFQINWSNGLKDVVVKNAKAKKIRLFPIANRP